MTTIQLLVMGVSGYGIGLFLAALFFATVPNVSYAMHGFRLSPQIAAGVALMTMLMVLLAAGLSLRRVLMVAPFSMLRS